MESNDSTPYLIEAARPIVDELWDRVEGELSPPDEIAVGTALSKALAAGFRQGAAAVVFEVERHGINVNLSMGASMDADPWAEHYGDG